MGEFLSAVFSKRFKFGLPLGLDATVSIRAGFLWCWSCGALTRIVTGIDVGFGPNIFSFTIPEFGKHPQPLDSVLSQLPDHLEIGCIKPRFSKTQGRSYMSNGCFHCDALIGEFFEHDAWDEQETVFVFSIQISKQWQKAIKSHCGYETAWSVCPLPGHTAWSQLGPPGESPGNRKLAGPGRELSLRAMRHMAHSCVTFSPEKTLEWAQCDTVLAQNGGRIGVMAKKPAGAGA
jgi:hypothetical protein